MVYQQSVTFRAAALGQRGLTLVELLVSLVISGIIVLAATSFFLSSSRTRDSQDAAGLLQDNARFLTEIITKNIQQAGYQNYIVGSKGFEGKREAKAAPDGEPDIRGYNNTAAGADILDNGVHNRSANRVNNSDTLILRFQGSSTTNASGVRVADGSMVDCLGRPQTEPITPGDRVYSIFEVQNGPGNEPELRCKFFNFATGVATVQPIVRGVETFQVMYGVDTDGDTAINSWCNAAEVGVASRCTTAAATTAVQQWALVRSVRVGIVLRAPDRVGVVNLAATYRPVGNSFTQGNTTDPGSVLNIAANDGRIRQVVTFTVNVRNQL